MATGRLSSKGKTGTRPNSPPTMDIIVFVRFNLGLGNALIAFHGRMDAIKMPIESQFTFLYLRRIVFFSKTLENHTSQVQISLSLEKEEVYH